ncbi:MAG: hypothetical protein V5A64_01315 [Candidatus Thermoplasmatota archaeon]
MKKEKETKKKIKTAAVISTVVISLIVISAGQGIIASDSTVSSVDSVDSIPEYYGNVTVTLSASDDDSGVNVTYYALDPVERPPKEEKMNIYDGPFEVSSDGKHIVYYFSVDNAGNKEQMKNTTFEIVGDNTAPETRCILDGPQ